MRTSWIIGGLIVLAFLILINLVGPLKGSSSSDFPDDFQPDESNPLPACPGSPNCVRISVDYGTSTDTLFTAIRNVLEDMGASEIEQNSQSLQFNSVFEIPLFGFPDDMKIVLTKQSDSESSVLHLLSQSRVGHGDLGVNRRRVSKFLKLLESNL